MTDGQVTGLFINDLTFWRDALAGKWPKIPDEPQCGLYRYKDKINGGWAGAYFYRSDKPNGDGEFIVKAIVDGGANFVDAQPLWSKCATHPISRAMYDHWAKTGEWLDHVHQDFDHTDGALTLDAVNQKVIDAEQWWCLSIKEQITKQSEADTAANFAALFATLETEAQNRMKSEITPIKQEEAVIRTRWQPIVSRCAEMKRTIKNDWLGPWLRAHHNSMAGSNINARRISIRITEQLRVTDVRAFCRWIAERNVYTYPDWFVKSLEKLAREIGSDDETKLPGTALVEEETVA